MVRILLSLLVIIGGLVLVFFALYNNTKKTMKIYTRNNSVPKKIQYFQRLLNLITGFCFIFIGIISFLNLFNGEIIGLLSSSVLLLDRVIEFIINRRYKEIN